MTEKEKFYADQSNWPLKFKTQWNGVETENKRFERVGTVSKTIPDQTMSVAEIMHRYAKGLPISGERVPVYHGDEEFIPDIKTLDLSEIEDMKIQAQNTIAAERKKIADLEAERKKIAENKKLNKQPLQENEDTNFNPDKEKQKPKNEDKH